MPTRTLRQLAMAFLVVSPATLHGADGQGVPACDRVRFEPTPGSELKSATQGAWFRYTLDGTTPTRTRGYVYCGAISVQPGIRVKAVAYRSGMADSEPGEAHDTF
jgi:hypothetical protein